MSVHSILPRHALMRYGFLALPLAFAGMPLYIHAPDYYATHMGLSLSSLGVVLLLLRLVDALQDPFIGRLSDRYSVRRNHIILVASILLVVSFVALFQPIDASYAMLWFALCMLMATTAFSIVSINLNTLGGLWSHDTQQKTRITSVREAFGLVGLLLAVVLPSVLMQSMPAASAFSIVSIVLAALMLIAVIIFSLWYNRQALTHVRNKKQSRAWWVVVLTLPQQTKQLLAVYAVSLIASSIPALLVLFFIRDRLDAEAYTGLFLALYFLSGVAGMPVWQSLARRKGKAVAWMFSMIIAVMGFSWAYFLDAGDIMQFAIICVVAGMAFGADLALPPSILADHIHAFNNEADASSQFSLLTFIAKFALALASIVAFPLLDAAGFTPAAENDAEALWTLSLAYAAIPCAIKSIAIIMLWRNGSSLNLGETHENHTTINGSTHHA